MSKRTENIVHNFVEIDNSGSKIPLVTLEQTLTNRLRRRRRQLYWRNLIDAYLYSSGPQTYHVEKIERKNGPSYSFGVKVTDEVFSTDDMPGTHTCKTLKN